MHRPVRNGGFACAIVCVALLATLSNALADDRTSFNGHWRGINPQRGGAGTFVSIVSMTVTPSLRSIRDSSGFTVTLRFRIDGNRPLRLRRAPAPPIGQHPLPDNRPGLVPDVQLADITTNSTVLLHDPEAGQILRVYVRPDFQTSLPANSACGFFISIVQYDGPLGDGLYYQIIPGRPCADGPFEGTMSLSRGILVR